MHFVVVPAHSTLRSTVQCGANDILICSSESNYAYSDLNNKVQALIGKVYTMGEGSGWTIDKAKVPTECLLEPATVNRVETDLEFLSENEGNLENGSAAAGDTPGTLRGAGVAGVPQT